MLLEKNGMFLFVRNSYGSGAWTVPGGGAHRGEDLENAASREVKEEVGVSVIPPIKLLGTFVHEKEYKKDRISVFLALQWEGEVVIDPIEVAEARWMKYEDVPDPRGSALQKTFDLLAQ